LLFEFQQRYLQIALSPQLVVEVELETAGRAYSAMKLQMPAGSVLMEMGVFVAVTGLLGWPLLIGSMLCER
jgi:hypothetical protein